MNNFRNLRARSVQWPSLANEAYYGLVGEIVREIEPHTEADPAALLVQLLVAFGNVVGRSAYFQIEADKHYTNLFAVVVGDTANGRKGTSWGHVRRIFSQIDNEWIDDHVHSGLSTGEGLIWHVRDAVIKNVKSSESSPSPQAQIIDDGVRDKRILCIEDELSAILRIIRREGNTLSAIVRRAWDSGNLKTMVKNSPVKATDAHFSIIGHITATELLRELTSTETANGFGNRFIWVCSRRSKCLPEGGQIDASAFTPLLSKLSDAVRFAKTAQEIKKDEHARAIWFEIYKNLSEGKPGIPGALTARGAPQVMRLATIYALFDLSSSITDDHLLAALAVWNYCESSCFHIFGDAVGDPIADQILDALNENNLGLTQTEITSGVFKGHRRASEIQTALDLLIKYNRAQVIVETGLEGRKQKRWKAIGANQDSGEIGEMNNVEHESSPISHSVTRLGGILNG